MLPMNELRVDTALGEVRLVADLHGLRAICFSGQAWEYAAETQLAGTALLQEAATWVQAYCAGAAGLADLPRTPVGTHFQRQVWSALSALPRGATSSYGALAVAIGNPAAVRALGAAVGRNPWSLLIPCHRVIGANGALTGYAGGLGRKRALLALESGSVLPWQAVISAYQSQYPQPLELRPGDAVQWQPHADDGQYPEWAFAVNAQGVGAWAPRDWFSGNARQGRSNRSYSSRELDVRIADQVLELDYIGGWSYVRHSDGRCGWLPQTVLAPVSGQAS
jgi:methylated-DNA-[protein]-cysteine S-methyltransferase